MSAQMGTNAHHYPQAIISMKVAKDIAGSSRSRSFEAMQNTYFHNKVYGYSPPPDVTNIWQDEPTFVEKLHQTGQVPEVRTSLNHIEYSPATIDLVKAFDTTTTLIDAEKDELIREVLMQNIVFTGTVHGDGFDDKLDRSSEISFDKFTVDSAGTVQFHVRGKDLGIGMEAELKVPLRKEWEHAPVWQKTGGKLCLYIDPLKRKSALEKISQQFSRYNLFERKDLRVLLESLMEESVNDMPTNIKMVYGFSRLMMLAANLFRQKNISSGMFNVRRMSYVRPNAYPSFTNDVATIIPADRLSALGYGIRDFNPAFELPFNPTLNADSVTIPFGRIQKSAYHPEKFNFAPVLFDARSASGRTVHGRNTRAGRFESSIDFLSIINQLSGLTSIKSRGQPSDNPISSERLVSTLAPHDKEKFTTILYNGYTELYNTLTAPFMPQTKAPFFIFGLSMTGLDPVVNDKLFTRSQRAATQTGSSSRSRVVQPSKLQDFVEDVDRDYGATASAFWRALPSYLHSIVNYTYDMNNGYRIAVVEAADYGQAGNTYIRC